jgi:hypothetical protein
MNNIILLEKETFNHMGDCIKMGHLGRELLDMARRGVSHYEECLVGPRPDDLSSPVRTKESFITVIVSVLVSCGWWSW